MGYVKVSNILCVLSEIGFMSLIYFITREPKFLVSYIVGQLVCVVWACFIAMDHTK